MARMIRFENAGAKFTEDCSVNRNTAFEYVSGDMEITTPFGKRIRLDSTSRIDTNTEQNFIQQTGIFTVAYKCQRTTDNTYSRVVNTLGGSPVSGWRTQFQISPGFIDFYIRNVDAANICSFVWSTGVDTKELHTYMFIGDGVGISLYVDGMLISKKTYTSTTFSGTQGIFSTIAGVFDTGYLSDIVIDNRAWDTQEVLDYHNNTTFDYGKMLWSEFNVGGELLEDIDAVTAVLISNNKKSDNLTDLGLTQLQLTEFNNTYITLLEEYGGTIPIELFMLQKLTGTTDGLVLDDSIGELSPAKIGDVNCLDFDGVLQHILTPAATLGNSFTLEFEGVFDSTAPNYSVLFYNETNSTLTGTISFNKDVSANRLSLVLYPNGGTRNIMAMAALDVWDDMYHTVKLVYDNGSITVFKDGDSVYTNTITPANGFTTANVMGVGSNNLGTGNHFKGQLYGFSISDFCDCPVEEGSGLPQSIDGNGNHTTKNTATWVKRDGKKSTNLKNGFNFRSSAADPYFKDWVNPTTIDSWSNTGFGVGDYIEEDVDGVHLFIPAGNSGYLQASTTANPNNIRTIVGHTYKYKVIIKSITSGKLSFRYAGGSGQFLTTSTAGEFEGEFTATNLGYFTIWRSDPGVDTDAVISYCQLFDQGGIVPAFPQPMRSVATFDGVGDFVDSGVFCNQIHQAGVFDITFTYYLDSITTGIWLSGNASSASHYGSLLQIVSGKARIYIADGAATPAIDYTTASVGNVGYNTIRVWSTDGLAIHIDSNGVQTSGVFDHTPSNNTDASNTYIIGRISTVALYGKTTISEFNIDSYFNYAMDDGSGLTIADSSGNGNPGTVSTSDVTAFWKAYIAEGGDRIIDVLGNPLTNLTGISNGSETTVQQTDARLLRHKFWSEDGITFDKKTDIEFIEEYNNDVSQGVDITMENNAVVKCNTRR